MDLNKALPSIDASRFSMVPRSDIPRAKFRTEHKHKATMNVDYLYPILAEEVLPADVHQGKVTIVARLNDLLFPLMDNLFLETFFFFVPNRLLWTNWVKMMGERANPSDSISFTTPYIDSAAGGFPINSIYDHFGLPTVGQVTAGQDIRVNALPLRAYWLIFQEWFKDQNLQTTSSVPTGDGPDSVGYYSLQKRNKRHDYFTSALPWPLKGGTEVTIPLGGQAPVKGIGILTGSTAATADTGGIVEAGGTGNWGATSSWKPAMMGTLLYVKAQSNAAAAYSTNTPQIYADLASATGQTINALRLAFQTQKLLERDARGGTRYTEILRSHFGVNPQDARLQRPEYIGGGRSMFHTQAIPQTSATGLTGGSRPLGSLGAQAAANDQHSFSYQASEHGWIIGLANITGEITYQQGLARKWTRQTRYDYYWPAFAHLGEQAIRNDEIYASGTNNNDTATFGYQERWAEYRHRQSQTVGLFRSTSAGTIHQWHLAEVFGSAPALNTTFIQQTTPLERALAAGATANNMQILWDSVFRITSTRPLPMYSVPGMIDRF